MTGSDLWHHYCFEVRSDFWHPKSDQTTKVPDPVGTSFVTTSNLVPTGWFGLSCVFLCLGLLQRIFYVLLLHVCLLLLEAACSEGKVGATCDMNVQGWAVGRHVSWKEKYSMSMKRYGLYGLYTHSCKAAGCDLILHHRVERGCPPCERTQISHHLAPASRSLHAFSSNNKQTHSDDTQNKKR